MIFTFIMLYKMELDIDNKNNKELINHIIDNYDTSYIRNIKSVNDKVYNKLVYNRNYGDIISFKIEDDNVNCVIKLNHLLNNDFNNNAKNVIIRNKQVNNKWYLNIDRALDNFEKSINELENEEEIIYKFNFTFTTNDSDIIIFEPFMTQLDDLFYNNYNLELNDDNIDDIFKMVRDKKISIDEINNFKDDIKNKLNEQFFNNIENVNEDKYLYQKKYKRYLQPLIKTLINVKIEYEFSKYFNLPLDKKICPHIKKRTKK